MITSEELAALILEELPDIRSLAQQCDDPYLAEYLEGTLEARYVILSRLGITIE